jgi:hypothetical protein
VSVSVEWLVDRRPLLLVPAFSGADAERVCQTLDVVLAARA